MTWVKLDDAFFTNPKVITMAQDGVLLYIVALCYCASGLTDGHVPLAALSTLGALAKVRKSTHTARELVKAGLWETASDGYQVHDYLKYQPSAEDVRRERRRVAEWRTKHVSERVPNGVPDSVPDTVPNGVQNAYETNSERRPKRVRNNVPARPGPVGTGLSGEESLNAAAAAVAAPAARATAATDAVPDELLAEMPEEVRERLSKTPIGTGKQRQPRRLNDILNGRQRDAES